MPRSSTLALLVLVVGVSGCLAGGGSSVDTTPSTAPTTQQSIEFPSKPAQLTTESVERYVVSYEQAYRKQEIYDTYGGEGATVSDLIISTHNRSTVQRDDATFLVTYTYMVGYNVERGEDVAASDMRYTAQYYVNATTVLRDATTGVNSAQLDPVANGTAIETTPSKT